jgi:hypothetical protein
LSAVTTTAATVIAGVSLYSEDRRRNGDRFDLALSSDGIEIRRRGQVTRQLSWDRVTKWELEDRRGGVLLTLRGDGAVTPLLVPRWSVDDLAAVLRDATTQTAPVDPAAPWAPAPSAPAAEIVEAPAQVEEPAVVAAAATPEAEAEPASPSSAREERRGKSRFTRRKVVVTVVLLGVLAAAVTLVLLQSAGVIHVGFLGPTA